MVIEIVGALIIGTMGFVAGTQVSLHHTRGIRKNNELLRQNNRELQDSIDFWTDEFHEKQRQCNFYRDEMQKYQQVYRELMKKEITNQKVDVDADVREAIKFAMTNAHPDKPCGSQDKFLKFHKLYKKHCK